MDTADYVLMNRVKDVAYKLYETLCMGLGVKPHRLRGILSSLWILPDLVLEVQPKKDNLCIVRRENPFSSCCPSPFQSRQDTQCGVP